MRKSEKQKSDKQNDDVIEGSATIIDEAEPKTKTSSKTASNKTKETEGAAAPVASSLPFPKLAFAAVILGIISLGISFYLGMMVIELESAIEQNSVRTQAVQQQGEQNYDESQVALLNLQRELDNETVRLKAEFETLIGDFEALKTEAAQASQNSPLASSAPLALPAVMVVWANAQQGERLDVFAPLIKSLPASQTKDSLNDILALAGGQSHQSLIRKAALLSQSTKPVVLDNEPTSLFDDFKNWLSGAVNLRPLKSASEAQQTQDISLPQIVGSPADKGGSLSLEGWLSKLADSHMPEIEAWRLEAQARLQADKALDSLLQALISQQIKG